MPISVSALWPARTELAELEAEAELERLRSSAARERKAKKRGTAGGTNSLCRRQR